MKTIILIFSLTHSFFYYGLHCCSKGLSAEIEAEAERLEAYEPVDINDFLEAHIRELQELIRRDLPLAEKQLTLDDFLLKFSQRVERQNFNLNPTHQAHLNYLLIHAWAWDLVKERTSRFFKEECFRKLEFHYTKIYTGELPFLIRYFFERQHREVCSGKDLIKGNENCSFAYRSVPGSPPGPPKMVEEEPLIFPRVGEPIRWVSDYITYRPTFGPSHGQIFWDSPSRKVLGLAIKLFSSNPLDRSDEVAFDQLIDDEMVFNDPALLGRLKTFDERTYLDFILLGKEQFSLRLPSEYYFFLGYLKFMKVLYSTDLRSQIESFTLDKDREAELLDSWKRLCIPETPEDVLPLARALISFCKCHTNSELRKRNPEF